MLLGSCTGNDEELPFNPPPTNPLGRAFIGYGVVNVSFTHVSEEPEQDGLSLGYLRRGSLVKILERRSVVRRGSPEAWLFVSAAYQGVSDGVIRGWLREGGVDVYDNESQARTASEAMAP
ncbi:MAG: hypothetical protein LBC62_09610 [Treponema sp.]|jgi:hypothetical protein|nr:hypothetical protein [Treponema sp.]